MDLKIFRQIVDQTPARITDCQGDPVLLYKYVGLALQSSYQLNKVNESLYDRIRNAFANGHGELRRMCRSLETDLIREHVILDAPLNPYFDVLSCIRDALLARKSEGGEIAGNWVAAIQAARDHVAIRNWGEKNHERIYAREFSVSRAAKFLKQQGYGIRLGPGIIALEESAEESLVGEIEKLIAQLGGLNVARRIFVEISTIYDADLQRYHIVPHTSMTGGGSPQIPWGYLLQLAVKHIDGRKPYLNLDTYWNRLKDISTAYAAVIDVQPYVPSAWLNFDANGLIKFLQEQALYDSIFRFLQLRASDVLRLCRGALSFLDSGTPTPSGWTLEEAYDVIGYLVSPERDVRGPILVVEADVRRALPHIAKDRITAILKDVFSHPEEGANQGFSRPTDAPTPTDKSKGADFYLKPLLKRPGNRYVIIDRSMCGWGYLEALLTALRPLDAQFDDKVGLAIEGFLEAEFASHDVPIVSGDYDLNGEHGECDLVAMTSQTLVFMELKKKSLTRRARAGSDADLLLDLAGSLLAAQAQAGWHELRINNAGSLELLCKGDKYRLSVDGRSIEKVAVGMLDFGSFQDRIMLKQFLEATLNVNFGSPDPTYAKRFKAINDALQEIREQYAAVHQGKTEVHQPFFNCWFISVPQLLVLLDDVTDAESFRKAFWNCRHFTTGTSDLYYEISYMRRLKANGA
jgi:Holliday junction resolvase-like predicted endonuclease